MEQITLHSPWFELVKSDKKIYEGRRKTSKIDNLNVGQYLIVYRIDDSNIVDIITEPFIIVIEEKINFNTFEDALKCLPIEDILPIENINVSYGVEIYKKYVSLETQNKYGIVILKIKRV